jgi:hypothetical protein
VFAEETTNCVRSFLAQTNVEPSLTMVLTMMVSPSKKSVQFAPNSSLCSYRPSEIKELSQEIIDSVWFQTEDFAEFQANAKKAVDTAVRKGLSAYIKEPYGQRDSNTQEMLNVWARCCETRRGLERYVNEEYGQQRLFHRRKTIQAILYSQERLKKENQSLSRAASILQTVASTLSANSTEFARMMAVADREAVRANQNVISRGRKPNLKPVKSLKEAKFKCHLPTDSFPTGSGIPLTQTHCPRTVFPSA